MEKMLGSIADRLNERKVRPSKCGYPSHDNKEDECVAVGGSFRGWS